MLADRGVTTSPRAPARAGTPRLAWTVIRDGADTILRVTADPDRPDDVAAIKHLFDAGLHL